MQKNYEEIVFALGLAVGLIDKLTICIKMDGNKMLSEDIETTKIIHDIVDRNFYQKADE